MDSPAFPPGPLLERWYQRFLETEDSAAFVEDVSRAYSIATLERLVTGGRYLSRRAAVLALGYVADFRSNAVLGRALHDKDRGVRMLADDSIRDLWRRDGDLRQRSLLERVCQLNADDQHREALEQATQLIDEAPTIAETWNQRAIAWYHLGHFVDAANDCCQTLELNEHHFLAAIGLAHCYLELEDGYAALEAFRRALRLNPDLEDVRVQVNFLSRTLEGR